MTGPRDGEAGYRERGARQVSARQISARSIRERRPGVREAGMVTAELAVGLPAIVLVLALAVGVVQLGLAQIRCQDAAGVAARAAARGDSPARIEQLALTAAPAGAQLGITGDRLITVTVTAPGTRLLAWWPTGVEATATAVREGET